VSQGKSYILKYIWNTYLSKLTEEERKQLFNEMELNWDSEKKFFIEAYRSETPGGGASKTCKKKKQRRT
jgi:hypothetical protein